VNRLHEQLQREALREGTGRKRGSRDLSSAEKQIVDSLNRKVSMSVRNCRLLTFVQAFQKKAGFNIVVDTAGIEEAHIDYNTPVSFDSKDATLETALKRAIGPLKLGYLVQNEVLFITSEAKVRQSVRPLDDSDR
jgi:hypothetical protein